MPDPNWRALNAAKATAARVRRKHERMACELRLAGYRITEPGAVLCEEARTALRNWMYLHEHHQAEIHWDGGILLSGDSGSDISVLAQPGLTPATNKDEATHE